jgi:hypothetical protein
VRQHVERGFGKSIGVSLAYQRIDALPEGSRRVERRTRPWGTGHAILAAAEHLSGPFAVANADDLYGLPAITALGSFLTEGSAPPTDRAETATWASVGFPVGGTLPEQGAVSRAFITAEQGWIRTIDEVLRVRRHPHGACLGDRGSRIVPADAPVSMNLWGFDLSLLTELDTQFRCFLEGDPGDDEEFLLPVVVGRAIREGRSRVRLLPTTSPWCGITSAADQDAARAELARRVAAGIYPDPLWGRR